MLSPGGLVLISSATGYMTFAAGGDNDLKLIAVSTVYFDVLIGGTQLIVSKSGPEVIWASGRVEQ